MKKLISAWMTAATLMLLAPSAFADRAAYSGVVDLKRVSSVMTVEHHHDWSNPLHMSSLRAVDRTSGKQLFDISVPAITYLWISPDSHYIVGLSNIKYLNKYQLIVLSDSGPEVLKQDLTDVDWARPTGSVTNWLNWYKSPEPRIVLTTATHTLEIEDASGVMRMFQL